MWGKDEAECGSHLAQLYGDDEDGLVQTAGRYLRRGLRRGEGLVLIATADHADRIRRELEREAVFGPSVRAGLVMFLDAEEVLARVLVEGQPDSGQFDRLIGGPVRDLRDRTGCGVRVFAELVGLLWCTGQVPAANRLEELWNGLLRDRRSHLFCAYPIDVFSSDFELHRVDGLLCSHGRLIPSDARLESSVRQAMHDVLGMKAEGLELLMEALDRPYWAVMPKAEVMILWLKNILPDDAEEILRRARDYQVVGSAA